MKLEIFNLRNLWFVVPDESVRKLHETGCDRQTGCKPVYPFVLYEA